MKRNKNKIPEFLFMAFFNRWGVALASNIRDSILHISQDPPAAFIYDPTSGFKWDNLAIEFKNKMFADHTSSLNEVAIKFNDFIREKENPQKFLEINKQEILYVGYNGGEIYPSMMGFEVSLDPEGKIIFEKIRERHINSRLKAFISLMGNFNYILPLISGISKDFETALWKQLTNRTLKLQEKLKNQNLDPDSETPSEDSPEEGLMDDFSVIMNKSSRKAREDVLLGLDSFSIQDMGDAIKNLINAETRFSRLKNKNKVSALDGVCERAVMTVPEGFTLIERLKNSQS